MGRLRLHWLEQSSNSTISNSVVSSVGSKSGACLKCSAITCPKIPCQQAGTDGKECCQTPAAVSQLKQL